MSVITDLIDENSSCHARIAELEARIVWLECELQVNAAPVPEAKAQGVVMQSTDGGRNPRYEGLFDGETEEQRASRLNATPVQHPKCKTCDDNGRIGGPSFYAPDEGGYPCPDCSAPVQRVSVPDGFERYRLADKFCEQRLVTDDHVRAIVVDAFASGYGFGIAAAPAAPAADAGDVLDQAMYTLISIGYHENSGLVHELRQALAAHSAKGVV